MDDTPGRILRMLRESKGYKADRKSFAELTGWSYDICKNLETGRTLVTNQVLEQLIEAEWMRKGDEWWDRFQAAIKQAALPRAYEAGKLTWADLRGICAEITGLRMAPVRGRYDARRYLQREPARRAFETFLRSDKRCFVLIGKSGVGKSNFFLALADELRQRDDLCILMYDGAQIKVEPAITDTITRDFSYRVRLADHPISDIWRDIAAIDGIHERTVLLVVDAINENPQAKELLRQLDDLVQGPDWLKVAFSSRPESWRAIRSGVKLAESLYYRAENDDSLGVELERFSYSGQLEPFSEFELPQAYAKYRAFYGLQTAYEGLDLQIRKMLADPFNLWLVAKTYRRTAQASGEIPASLRATELVKKYVEDPDILRHADREFLANELVPLFVRDGRYRNALTRADIREAGRALSDAVYGESLRGDDVLRHQAFENLVNADILTRQGEGANEKIAFKYERFYEFFVGNHMHEASASQPGTALRERTAYYMGVASALSSRVYLWGALVQALILELEADRLALLAGLAPEAGRNRLLRGALVNALVLFGEDHGQKARAFINELIGQLAAPSRTSAGRVWRLVRTRRKAEAPVAIRQVIAVESAAQLGMTDVLSAAAGDASRGLRAAAVLHTFYLWKQDWEGGFQVLERLCDRFAGRRLVPDIEAIESALALSGAILGQTRDARTLARLLAVARRALRQIFFLGDLDQSGESAAATPATITGFVRERVVNIILEYVVHMLGGWGDRVWASPANMGHIFELSHDQKQLLGTLIPLLDADAPGLSERAADMPAVLDWGDVVAECVVGWSILSHGVRDFDGTLPILQQLVDAGLQPHPPTFWASGLVFNYLLGAVKLGRSSPALDELAVKTVRAIQEEPESWLESARQARPVPTPTDSRASSLQLLVWSSLSMRGHGDSPELGQYLEQALAAGDAEYLIDYIRNEVTPMIDSGYCRPALEALLPVAGSDQEQVREVLIDTLVRIRQNEPERAEDWLLEYELPPEIVQRVLAYPPAERVNDLMAYQLLWILLDLFLWGPKFLRRELQWLLSVAFELTSFKDWLKLMIKELTNLILGEPVLKVPEHAPSRQLQSRAAAHEDGDLTPPLQ